MDLLMSVWRGLCALAVVLLGRWAAPAWLRWLAGVFGEWATAGGRRVKAQPRFYVLWGGLLVLASVAIYGGHRWWESRPKSPEVTFEVKSPGLTDYAAQAGPKPIELTFSESAAPPGTVGKVVTGVTLMPALDGEWTWVDDRKLVFKPRNDWPIGARFKGVLGPALVSSQVNLKTRDFEVTTQPFKLQVTSARFYQDPEVPTVKKGLVEVVFSHPVNAAEFEKRIEMKLADQGLGLLGIGRSNTPFTVVYDKSKTRATIHSSNLPVPKDQARLETVVGKGVVAQAGGLPINEEFRSAVKVPGLYSLAVDAIEASVVSNEQFEPERVLTVRLSHSVHERDVAKHVTAWVLPELQPGTSPEASKGVPKVYGWSDLSEVTSKVLAESARLELTPLPGEREHGENHAFKFKADVGRVIYVQVEPQLKSFGGHVLPNRFVQTVTVAPYDADLRIMSKGAILPLSGGKKVAVLTRELPGLRLEIGRVQPGQVHHLVSQAKGNFANPEFLGQFGEDNISDRFDRTIPLAPVAPGKNHYETLDLGAYMAKDPKDGEPRKGLFLLKVQGFNPRKPIESGADVSPAAHSGEESAPKVGGDQVSEETPNYADLQDKRLILVTDLGIVLKQSADGTRDVFVQSLFSGAPVVGASVDLIAKNGSSLLHGQTDAAGRVGFSKLEGGSRELAPLMVLVRKAGDMSFLPLHRSERTLDVSRFDVGGVRDERTPDQLKAYLFSDRGVYRPGDTMNLGVVVRSSEWTKSLEGVPLEVEILDSRGLAVRRERIRLGAGGFLEVRHTTFESAVTGNYRISVNVIKDGQVADSIGSTMVRVQEFMSDRTKASINFSSLPSEGWIHPKELKARVSAQNLVGTPAQERRVAVNMVLSPAWPAFKGFPDYRFHDPLRAKESLTEAFPETRTDSAGEVAVDLNLQRFAKATYRVSLLGQVFEPEGGASVAAEAIALVSEMPYLIGVKHEGHLDYVPLGSERVSHLIAVDQQAKKRSVDGLMLQFIERKSASVLIRQTNDAYRYESRRRDSVISESPLNIALNGYGLKLDTRKAGNFSYVVRDTSGNELSRIDYSVAGQGNVTRSLERNAELQLNLNKSDYSPGEEIEVSIRAPYVGAGLITIERDKVYAQSWFKTSTTASVQKIRLPADFQGNGYISVHFVRDPGSEEIFMSPLSFGVAPFATNLGARTNRIKLDVPEAVRPGQNLGIKLQVSQPTRAVVFAVDENILQAAGYKNPDPLGHFFQKRALEVKTSQVLDLLLPEFTRLMAAAAPGGDDAGAQARFLNPFKRKGEAPAVFWSGMVDVNSEGRFNYVVPDHFSGTLRVMAVAVNDGTVGVAQAKAVARGDFVLSPHVPQAVSPGDSFDVSVGVVNNLAESAPESPVLVTMRVPPGFEIQGPSSQTLKLGPMRDGVVIYKVKAKEAQSAPPGVAASRFSASLGSKTGTRRVDVAVRPTGVRHTTLSFGYFKGAAEVAVPRDLLPELRRQDMAVSALPLALVPALITQIEQSEHHSTERVVSRALASLVLGRRPEWGLVTPANAAKAFDDAVRVLRTRHSARGGFGVWTANAGGDEFSTVYAAHLLIEAGDVDLPQAAPPLDLIKSIQAYLQTLASSPAGDLADARTRAYAMYLLTRQGVVTAPQLASLRESLDQKFKGSWRTDAVASLMASTYQLLQQEKPAAELISGMLAQLERGDGAPYNWSGYHDSVIRDAQLLYLVSKHFPSKLKAIKPDTYGRFMAPLGQGQVNTVSAAYTVLAFEAIARNMGAPVLGKLSAEQVNLKGQAAPLQVPLNVIARSDIPAGAVRIKLTNEGQQTVYYALTQSGFDRAAIPQELRGGMEISREYLDAKSRAPGSIKVGDEILVRLTLKGVGPTPAASVVPNVALTDLIPGGFEPVQSRDDRGVTSTVTGPGLQFADVRDDRVVIYTQAGPNPQTFTYRIRATHAGEFTVPPAFAESLYERSKRARSVASRLTAVSK